ncbi:MAG: PhnD/SsuA/transferrin family substrate-binding protein [Pontiellaceae bacterium]|nr:PhnD/SsuA/transferrin family substrate-binding protein [Pontiellaceae bacterium]MBN2784704.1 PhnD/SsuA/transferrin family substrate-binding protein [Pontiellaceae bacterium]
MRLIPLLLLSALFIGCTTPEPEPRLQLRIAVNDIYCTDTACACVHDIAARTYPETLDRLSKMFGIELQLDYFMDTYQLEDALRSGKYDGALCKPWYAMRLNKETDADFERLVDVLDPNNNRWLTGIVIVPTNSPISSMKELNGKHIYIGETDAYEKHYAALRLFERENIQPAKIDTNASCGENIGELQDGNADAAVISDYALSADCAVDFAAPHEFRILGSTEMIPLTSLLLNMDRVRQDDALRLREALLALSGEGAPDTLLGNGFVEIWPWNPPELEDQP